MWQRFTERARKAVFFAQEEAKDFGEGYVTTEHLLLGLLRDRDSLACRVLNDLGASPEAVREAVVKHLPRAQRKSTHEMMLTPRAKSAIDLAYDEARALDNDYIGTEHLLLGLIREGQGLAGRVLASFGITVAAARGVARSLQELTRGDTRERNALSGFDQALVRLAASLAVGDLELTREAAQDLRAAGASRAQVSELSHLVAALTKEDISHLIKACEEVMDEGSD